MGVGERSGGGRGDRGREGATRAWESINSLTERMATDPRFFRGLVPGR